VLDTVIRQLLLLVTLLLPLCCVCSLNNRIHPSLQVTPCACCIKLDIWPRSSSWQCSYQVLQALPAVFLLLLQVRSFAQHYAGLQRLHALLAAAAAVHALCCCCDCADKLCWQRRC
jgi:hypothetical protein